MCKEEKCEENGAIFINTYLVNYSADFFQILYVRSHIYGGHKLCEFDRNQPSGYTDMRG